MRPVSKHKNSKHPWGTIVCLHPYTKENKDNKLDLRALRYIFWGIHQTPKGYMLGFLTFILNSSILYTNFKKKSSENNTPENCLYNKSNTPVNCSPESLTHNSIQSLNPALHLTPIVIMNETIIWYLHGKFTRLGNPNPY